jgi:hypothetical protein
MRLSRISAKLASFIFRDSSSIRAYCSVSLSLAVFVSSDVSSEEIILLQNSPLLQTSTVVGSSGIWLFETVGGQELLAFIS